MRPVWFDSEAARPSLIGPKAFQLCRLTQAGLPIPRGFCVPAGDLHSELDTAARSEIDRALTRLAAASLAVRSSGIDEDGRAASFAGIFPTRLNLRLLEEVLAALSDIRDSASTPAALAYRRRHRIETKPQMAAIIQEFVAPEAAGVLFMKDPVDRSDRIVVEGSWGLGESIVSGLVTPDRWVVSRDGNILSARISDKDTALVPGPNGDVVETSVQPACRRKPCLDSSSLSKLIELARQVEQALGEPQDIEWAVASDQVWILQSRPITA
jgi:pyruvate,water dikinase